MRKYDVFLYPIVILLFSACAQQEGREMWQPSPTYIGVEPNDDAPVKAGALAAQNFAQDKTLTVEHDASMAYLKFFIPGFSKVDSAILNIQTKEVHSPGSVSIYEVMDTNWDETRLSWEKRPEIGTVTLATLELDAPQKVYEIDLTDFVKQKYADEDYYICLCFKADNAGTNVSFASVEDYDNLKPRFMICGLTYVPPPPPEYAPAEFKHPGILVTQSQIEFVREKIQAGQSPWKEAFDAARQSEFTQASYQPSPFEILTKTGFYNRSVSSGHKEFYNDAQAALSNAQLWALTDSIRYAQKAIEIINGWSATNKEITGGNDKLASGTATIQFANAAEILKHTNTGWRQQDQDMFEHWLRSVVWPILRDYIPAYNGNWDAIIGQALLSMAVFLDDKFIFDHAVNYYLNGIGNGKMSYYVREDGTTQETLRDQGHEQMGVGALAGFAEIAWNQGLDLYSKENSRLLKGVEGTARRVLEINDRRLALWESIYNHYHNRMGRDMPYTEKLLNMPGYRPEGYGSYRGFNTLFFYGLGDR